MLSASEARLLDRLILGASSASPLASASGLRRTTHRGAGLEFQDYRRYQAGDDPRLIDWTVEARLRQLVVRVSRAEGHLRLHLLLDVSGSMGVGTPDKLACAKKVAAALCYVAVERRDAVAVATFDNTVRDYLPIGHGRTQLARAFEVLGAASARGQSSVDSALMKYGGTARGPGLVVVFSDFFQSTDALEGVRYLLHRGLTPVLVQVLATEELNPDVTTEIELTDIEESAPSVIIDETALRAYRERLARLSAGLRDFCLVHRLPYLQLESSDSFERLLHSCEQASIITAYA
jgi:uncharacterized protein (DUF58 family)